MVPRPERAAPSIRVGRYYRIVVSAPKTKVLNVRVSAPVKERLSSAATESGQSVNDLAVGILAAHFGVKFEGTGRRSPGTHTPAGPLLLRVPERIYAKVHSAALSRSKTDVVESILRQHFDLDAALATA